MSVNAIEFVKKYGWGEAILNYSSCKHQYYFHYNGHIEVYVADLKQIVDAFNLVESFGGLFQAKVTLYKEGFTGGAECGNELIEDDVLKQAIELVEKCNES